MRFFRWLRPLVLLPAFALLGLSCVSPSPRIPTPAADPASRTTTTAPPHSTLATDDITAKTKRLLAAVGANRLEGLKPMKMDGMDHSKMPGMQPEVKTPPASPPAGASPMDHSKMPGMGAQQKAMPEMDPSQTSGVEGGAKVPPTSIKPVLSADKRRSRER